MGQGTAVPGQYDIDLVLYSKEWSEIIRRVIDQKKREGVRARGKQKQLRDQKRPNIIDREIFTIKNFRLCCLGGKARKLNAMYKLLLPPRQVTKIKHTKILHSKK